MHSPVYFFILVVIHLVHALYLNIVFFLQVASDEEQGDEEQGDEEEGDEEPPLGKRTAGMATSAFNRSLAEARKNKTSADSGSDEGTDSA